jgi:hypothetical protein
MPIAFAGAFLGALAVHSGADHEISDARFAVDRPDSVKPPQVDAQ